jgi:peptidoglycan/LPS O-acetylase OafA/YrhL
MSPFAPGVIWIVSVVGVVISVKLNDSIWGRRRFASAARVIGLTTYPMYLLHDLVGAAAFGWMLRLGVNKYWALMSVLLAISVLALIIATRIEPVIQAGLRDALDRIARHLRPRHKPKRSGAMPQG